jgi:hypothetical protein
LPLRTGARSRSHELVPVEKVTVQRQVLVAQVELESGGGRLVYPRTVAELDHPRLAALRPSKSTLPPLWAASIAASCVIPVGLSSSMK